DRKIEVLVVLAIVLQERADWDVNEIVLRLAEDRSDRLGDSDHLKGAPVDVNGLADGIGCGKEFSGDVLPDERNLRARVIIRICDVAAGLRFFHVHIGDVSGDSANVDVVKGLCPEADSAAGASLKADGFRQLHAVVQSLVVVPGNVSVAARGFQKVSLIGDD